MNRILIIGADGQVGWELRRTLAVLGEVVTLIRADLDLARTDDLRVKVRELRPNLIVNAAAYTAVDRAETEEKQALLINGDVPAVLAEESARCDAWLIHYSTDYVFDGRKSEPYVETDEPNPLNAYGRTKLAGEKAVSAIAPRHLIFRTSWVYTDRGKNFFRTMLRLASAGKQIRVVDDQKGAPTWSRLIAEATAAAVYRVQGTKDGAQLSGTYHLTCSGEASWYVFASAIFLAVPSLSKTSVIPIPSSEYGSSIQRPTNSVLSNAALERAFGLTLPHWRDALLTLTTT